MPAPADCAAAEPDLAAAVEAFESALHRGQQPRLADFLPRPDDTAILIELLHIDLEFKLKHGAQASVADYLANCPQLAAARPAVLELIEAEFKFRSRRDPSLTRAAFL